MLGSKALLNSVRKKKGPITATYERAIVRSQGVKRTLAEAGHSEFESPANKLGKKYKKQRDKKYVGKKTPKYAVDYTAADVMCLYTSH